MVVKRSGTLNSSCLPALPCSATSAAKSTTSDNELMAITGCRGAPRQVLMGAASVNSNGTVVSRIGSAAVAMMADAAGVPVIICCETYKFANKVCCPA